MGAARRADDKTLKSIEEALAALRKVASDKGDSVRDLARKMGRHPRWIQERLAEARHRGLLETGRSHREAIDGTMRMVTVYRVKGAK